MDKEMKDESEKKGKREEKKFYGERKIFSAFFSNTNPV